MDRIKKLFQGGAGRSQVAISANRISNRILEIANTEFDDLLLRLDASERGLTEAQVEERQREYGYNEVAHELPPRWYWQLLRNLKNPFIVLLILLSIVSYLTGDMKATLVLSIMVAVSVLLRFAQEFRATRSAEKLKAMVSTKATVARREHEDEPPKRKDVPLKELVPGDIVHLSAGDMVPADVRLLTSKDLFISQAVLTGESLPIEKYDTLGAVIEKRAQPTADQMGSALGLSNICFMGTNIVSGAGTAIVVGTGDDTYFGSMAKHLIGHRSITSFDRGINSVSWLLINFMLVMVPIVLLINGFTKGNWMEAFFFALSVAVGLTPEMLPMIVTANLAKGAVVMSRKKVIVKRLNSIQNFGAMDVLCTDKTGTLTQDRIILERHVDLDGREDDTVLHNAYINSYYQTGLKNLLDVAVLERAELYNLLQLDRNVRKLDEIPFDFVRRRMSVVVEKERNQHLLITKGAVEEMMAICTQVWRGGQIVPLTPELRKIARELVNEMNQEGFRALAVAYKEISAEGPRTYSSSDESDLVLDGFISFLDPPKKSAASAVLALLEQGVSVKVLTGDNELVTRTICKWVGLKIDKVLLGQEIENMSDEHLRDSVAKTTVFAKLSPIQKSRVIRALQSLGHTVGYLGDGINDAAALRDADVGISVDSAADIAKESADIIMLEKDLMVLEEGVIEGRRTFGNIIKYIKMTASSNFGNVFSVLGASAFLPFLPMQPLQLLVQNLLYDFSQTSIPFDSVDKEYTAVPRKWESGGIAKFMIFIGPISSIFDYTTFALMWFVFAANTVEKQSIFQSGWFIEGLLSQTLIVHMIRTEKIPFFQSRPSLPLLMTTLLIMSAGIAIPYTRLGESMGLAPLPMRYFPWLIATLLSYCVLTQMVKVWFVKKFRFWL